MSKREDTFKVLFAIVLIGALAIALINHGCGEAGDDVPENEPPPILLR